MQKMDRQFKIKRQLEMVGTVLNWRALILSEDTDPAQGSKNYCIALLRQVSVLPSSNSRSL